jgi:exodeoxyribonuclease VII large subunit
MSNDAFSPSRWSVTELTRYVRELFETDYRLQDVEVEGEISNATRHNSGHFYFTMKDAGAQLRGVMWRSDVQAQRGELPNNGDRVTARGRLAIYEPRGEYQIICRQIRPAGLGNLYAELERLKAQLQDEGLFASERKRAIPERANVIGIVTGADTAALQDVLHTLGRRYPLARVILSPTPVQGEQAAPRIIAALDALNRSGECDVILMVRGGGSLEDLWCFNDERLVRAIAASTIPVVSGVGHEIDFTLVDFAADLRAPTPTAAAELVTQFTVDDLRSEIEYLQNRLGDIFSIQLIERRRQVDMAGMQLERYSPVRRIETARQRIDDLIARAGRAAQGQLRLRRAKLDGIRKALAAISPEGTLARGYAIVRTADGKILHHAAEAQPGEVVDIRLHQGSLKARVESSSEE